MEKELEKEFVTYPQALALKELGFNKPCFGWYNWTGKDLSFTGNEYVDVNPTPAPLKQQVFRWFRDNHGIEIILRPDCFNHESKKLREYVIISYNKSWKLEAIAEPSHFIREGCFNTPEEAENACIDKLIEIVKQNEHNNKMLDIILTMG